MDAHIPGLSCSTCNVDVSATIRDVAEDRAVICTNGHPMALHDETGRARLWTDSYDRLMQRFHNIPRRMAAQPTGHTDCGE
jgi:hypothetical protein